jgi:hypothetical protein
VGKDRMKSIVVFILPPLLFLCLNASIPYSKGTEVFKFKRCCFSPSGLRKVHQSELCGGALILHVNGVWLLWPVVQ